jgi:hypothetical protein
MLVMLCYILKKNVRVHWASEDIAEHNVTYDFSPEQSYLKLFLEADREGLKAKLLCNQYEYEILYKRTFPNVLLSPDDREEEEIKSDPPPGLGNTLID